MSATEFFVWGWIAHVGVDWFLQNEWQALNKTSLRHPAAWVHSGLHFLGALLVFPLFMALVLAISHLLIDTRVPLQKWRKLIRQTQEGPIMVPFALWQDQAAHILMIAAAALVSAKIRG